MIAPLITRMEFFMSTDFAVRQHQLDLGQCEQLCTKWSSDIERLLHLGGHLAGSFGATRVPLGSAINMLIRSKTIDACFESAVISPWLPHLRNETLLTLGEDIDAWSCPSPLEAWDQFLPSLYGQPKDVRQRIARHLKCSLVDTVATVRLYSASKVEALGRFEDAVPNGEAVARLIIRADDLADRIRQVCGTVLFTVHPAEPAAA